LDRKDSLAVATGEERQFRCTAFLDLTDARKKFSKRSLLTKGNLAAIDGWATLESPRYYEKTYQDEMEIKNLVDGFDSHRPLNIDKLFRDPT